MFSYGKDMPLLRRMATYVDATTPAGPSTLILFVFFSSSVFNNSLQKIGGG